MTITTFLKNWVIPVVCLTVFNYSFAQQAIKEHYIYDHDTTVYGVDSSEVFQVENLGSKVNSSHAESGPRISWDGNTLYFFRVGHPQNINKTEESRDIWYSTFNAQDSSWGAAQHMPEPINNFGDNSVHWISPDGKKLLLHNKYLKNKTVENGVSISYKQKDGSWSFPKELHIKNYKNDELCSFYMNDKGDKLIMAIHYKDSYGHQDLYISNRIGGDDTRWSEPVNLGPIINTAGSEATAFLASDNKTLYFSSNGRKGGLGGYDIYKCERKDSTFTKWTKPKNIGAPFNTPDDELYFSIPHSGDYMYLAHHFKTLTDSAEHSDIVRIRLEPESILTLFGDIIDEYTKELIDAKISFKRLSDGKIFGKQIASLDTGYLVKLPTGSVYEYTVEKAGYPTIVRQLDITALKKSAKRRMDIYLPPEPALVLSGYVYDKSTEELMVGHMVITNLETGEVVYEADIDPETPYEVSLPAGAKYQLMVEKQPDYLSHVENIDLRNLQEHKEEKKDIYLVPISLLTVELENIYFETAKSKLLPKSFEELDKVVRILETAPTITVEIGGHTDYQGSESYNLKLSQDRAQSVVDYIVSKGISNEKIRAKGYGEAVPVASNRTAEGRAQNRRVEFKIVEITAVN